MSQRVLGIDLGSHSVKIAEVEVGFRETRLLSLIKLPVAPGTEPAFVRSRRTLAAYTGSTGIVEAVNCGLPGDRVLMRLLDVPLIEARKLGAIIGNQLADDIPWEIEDTVFDHLLMPPPVPQAFVVAARRNDVRELIDELKTFKLEPRLVAASSLSYAGTVRRVFPEETVLVVDVGHCHTNLCLVENGHALWARTISRGGHQLTEAFREQFHLSYEEAEKLKERAAFFDEHLGATSERLEEQYARMTFETFSPLIRELRISLNVIESKLNRRPSRLLLCGGACRMRGMDLLFQSELRLPTERLHWNEPGQPESLPAMPEENEAFGALALGLALEQGGRNSIDLRQDEFAYRTDRSVFRERLLAISISLLVIFALMATNAFAALYALRQEETVLKAQLKKATNAVFGESVLTPSAVTRRLKGTGKAGATGPVLTDKTAYHILDYISRAVPSPGKIKLDVTKLEIKSGKTFITGTADTRSAIGDVVKALEDNECFTKVNSGAISDVAEGKKQFSITIDTKCF